jgi:hypothetical protein
MTARERAEAMFTAACRHDDGYSQAQCPDCIAAAVEAAEAAAYERAAREVETGIGEVQGAMSLAEKHALQHAARRVRALATGGEGGCRPCLCGWLNGGTPDPRLVFHSPTECREPGLADDARALAPKGDAR